jgi:hypothetical protein
VPITQAVLDALAAGDCSFNYGAWSLIPALPQSPPACWFLDPNNQQFQPRIVRATQDPARLASLIESNWATWTRYGDPEWFRVGDASDLDAPWTDDTLYNWTVADFQRNAPPSMVAAWQNGAGGRGMPPQLQNWVGGSGPSLAQQAAEAAEAEAAFAAEYDALRDLIDRVIPATFGQWQNALLAVNQPTGPVANAVLQILADFAAAMNARLAALSASGTATGQPVPGAPPFPYDLVPSAPVVEQLSPVAGDVIPGSAVPVDYGDLPPGSVPAEGTPLEVIPEEWLAQLPPSYQPPPPSIVPQAPPPALSFGPDTLAPVDMNGQTVPVAPVRSGTGLLLALGVGAVAVAFLATRKKGRRG